ncbi:MAG: hypothetical protein HRT45_17010, partial [Bdellovibrionales bacterium]|nr:hypothetical protein [Bdellovibrionales bacterium]
EPDGKFWDLYGAPILEHLDAQKCVVMEPPFADPLHFQPAKTEPLFYLDPLYMASVLGSRVPMFVLGSFQKKLIDMLCPRVQKSFGEAAPDLAFYQKRYSRFLLQRKLWAKILNRVQPKVVMMVRAEGNEGLIDVCRERGIPTVELQHGSPSAKKVNYDFGNQRKQLGADHFFAFGEFWKNQEFWARPKDSIHVIGYPYLERFRRKYKDVDKKDRQIVVLSQKALGEPLSRYVAEKMKPVADKVIYKLHPAEVNNWRQVYPWLARSGVQVIEGNEPPLHQLLAESQYQLGVYSTAVYEGIAFGCQTLLLDLPGIEFMEELFGQKTVQKLDPKREFEYPPIEQFDAAQLGAELFAPDWEGNLDRALTKVLRKEDYKPSPGSEPRP